MIICCELRIREGMEEIIIWEVDERDNKGGKRNEVVARAGNGLSDWRV